MGRLSLLPVVLSLAACSVKVSYEGSSYACDPPDGVCPPGQHCSLDGRCVADEIGGPDGAPGADAQILSDGGGGADATPQAGPPWWDESWAHRRQITITNVSANDTLDENYQVGVFLDLDELLAPGEPRDALRVMHYNGGGGGGNSWTEMTRVIDEVGTDERVWLPLWETLAPNQDVDHYWLYYGNLQAGPPDSDEASLFELWAPFTMFQLDLQIQGNATVVGGELRLDQNEYLRTFDTWGPGFAVDFSMRMPNWSPRAWGGFQRNGDFLPDEPWLIWVTRNPAAGNIWPEVLVSDTGQLVPFVGQMLNPGAEHEQYTVERTANHVRFRFNQVVRDTYTLVGPFGDEQQVRLTNEGGNPVFFDWMRVRRIVEPEPQVEIGPEGDVPSP